MMINFLKSRRKLLLGALVIALSFLFVFEYLSRSYVIAYTKDGHYCLPYTLWLIKKNENPRRGDYVSFVGYGVPNFADGVKWVKILSGMPGDKVEHHEIPLSQRDSAVEVIEVNRMPVQMRVQGHVFLSVDGRLSSGYTVFERDTKGRTLPMIGDITIPEGKYFVTATNPRSFDSRYWGLIDKKAIIGKAYPIY